MKARLVMSNRTEIEDILRQVPGLSVAQAATKLEILLIRERIKETKMWMSQATLRELVDTRAYVRFIDFEGRVKELKQELEELTDEQ